MLICAGIGVSVMTFSVSEPVSHFLSNPDTLGGTGATTERESIAMAMRFTFLHYGLAAWATYAVVGLALGLACHRYGQPMTMRSGLAPLLGRHLKGPLGHVIDVLAILAIIAGITTSIVLGIEQICAGLAELTGSAFFSDSSGNPPAVALMTALIMTTGVAITSIISGVNRGVKWTSELAALLFFAVLAVFVITGGGVQSVTVLFDGILAYLKNLVGQSLTLYDPTLSEEASAQRDWQSKWTIFYWAWWIAFAPFVGMFVAKISRGRTLREFILGVVFAPTLLCFVWFAGTGGTALLLELDGTAGGSILSADHAFRIFNTVDILLSPSVAAVFKGGLVLLILMLVVASSTAAIIAIKSIGAAGSAHAETPFHSVLWAFVIAANAGAVMAVGGVEAIRDVMIISAVPFSIILGLMLVSAVMIISAMGRR